MQKFKKKLKNSPKDTSQVLCSENSQLNKGKYICYGSIKLKEYFKFSDVEKTYHTRSLVWN